MKINIQTKILGSFLLVIFCSFLIFNISIQRRIITHFNQYCERESCMNPQGAQYGKMGKTLNENQISFLEAVQSSLYWTSLGALLVALLLSILLSDKITKPIRKMIKTTQSIAKGNYSQRLRVKGNDEIADLGNSLNEMANSLNKIEQLRKDLITNFSHEMATPLTTINGYLEAMEDGLIENCDQKMKIMVILKEETNRLITMVKDLRELSLIESGHFRIHTTKTSLFPLIQKIAQTMELLFAEKEIQLVLHCTEPSLYIAADQVRFPQIILNLLDNAFHYTKKGGKVTIQVSKTTNAQAEITIIDTGIGMDQKELPHIFERFYRTEDSRSRKSGGSGIGLSIVSDLVKLHQGSISVESKIGCGTIFHLFFPIL
jgi:two-component system sensor histidine kinase BaeS